MIEVTLLGKLRVSIGATNVNLRNAKAYALLSYMLVGNRKLYRVEDLVDLLWPDSPETRARHALSQTLYQLRTSIGHELVTRERDTLELRRALVRCDVVQFQRLVAEGQFAAAVELYSGDFLQDLRVGADHRFEHWRDGIATHLRVLYEGCVSAVLKNASSADPATVEELSRLSLALRPEDVQLILLHHRAVADQGRVGEAEQSLKEYIRLLSRTLSANDLSLLSNLQVALGQQKTAIEGLAPRKGAPLPFTGRASELAHLREWWASWAGSRSVHVLVGEPGIGKSRLVEQLCRFAAIRNASVVVAGASTATQRVPYSLVADVSQQLLNGCDAPDNSDTQFASLRAMVNGTWRDPAPSSLHERLIYTELAQLIKVSTEVRPVLIAIDDFQWVDATSRDVITYVAHATQAYAAGFLLATRPEGLEICEAFGDVVPVSLQQLLGMSAEDSSALLDKFQMRAHQTISSSRRSEFIKRADGNPFFLLSLAESGGPFDSGGGAEPVELPPSIGALLSGRLRNLDEVSLEALRCLAVLREAATVDTLRKMSGAPALAVARSVDVLCRMGLTMQHAYVTRITHDLVAEATYRNMPPAIRQTLHARAAELLASRGPAYVATHSLKAGRREEAHHAALGAAADARRIRAPKEAEYYLTMALDTATTSLDYDAAAALYVEHLCELDRPLQSAQFVEAARRHAERIGDVAGEIRCAVVELDASLGEGTALFSDVERKLDALVARACAIGDHNLAAHGMWVLSRVGEVGGSKVGIQRWLRLAEDIASCAAPEWAVPLLGRFAVLAYYAGEPPDAEEALAQAFRLAGSNDRLVSVARAYEALYATMIGQLAEAEVMFRAVMDQAADATMQDMRYVCSVNLAVLETDIGKYAEALEHFSVTGGAHGSTSFLTHANLALCGWESQNHDAARSEVEWLERMAGQRDVLVARSTVLAIGGLLALVDGDLERAVHCSRELESLLEQECYMSDDSYCRMLVARVHALDNPRRSIVVLDVLPPARRPAVPQLRIDLERAYHLRKLDRAAGDAALIEVKARAEKMGALPIAKRAQVVLDGGELP